MCHVWNWLCSKWNYTRSREPEVSLKSHLVPPGRQLEHLPIFRVGWKQFIHIHPKNTMQHIAEEGVEEEQAEATFISLNWELVRSWELRDGDESGGVTFICSWECLGGGPCPALLPPPLSTEVSTASAATVTNDTLGAHTERVRWTTFFCVSLEDKDHSNTNLGNMMTLTLAYKNAM